MNRLCSHFFDILSFKSIHYMCHFVILLSYQGFEIDHLICNNLIEGLITVY